MYSASPEDGYTILPLASLYGVQSSLACTWWQLLPSAWISGTFDSSAWRFLRAPPQQQASYWVRLQCGNLRISLSCWKPHRWLRSGDSRIAADPAATDLAICANVKSMNRLASSTLSASRPTKDGKPRTAFSARRGLGPPWCPGIATSLALLSVEQSTAHMAASHESTKTESACWTSNLDRSWRGLSSQSIGSTRHPHQASAYATGAFSPEKTSRA